MFSNLLCALSYINIYKKTTNMSTIQLLLCVVGAHALLGLRVGYVDRNIWHVASYFFLLLLLLPDESAATFIRPTCWMVLS